MGNKKERQEGKSSRVQPAWIQRADTGIQYEADGLKYFVQIFSIFEVDYFHAKTKSSLLRNFILGSVKNPLKQDLVHGTLKQ